MENNRDKPRIAKANQDKAENKQDKLRIAEANQD